MELTPSRVTSELARLSTSKKKTMSEESSSLELPRRELAEWPVARPKASPEDAKHKEEKTRSGLIWIRCCWRTCRRPVATDRESEGCEAQGYHRLVRQAHHKLQEILRLRSGTKGKLPKVNEAFIG